MSKELTYMYKTIAILLSLLLVFGMLSCNLDGSGIFLTISKSTEIADSNLATEPVRDILYKDGDDMYILHRTSVKRADISVADPTWTNVDFSKPISEAVYYNGVTDKLYFSSINSDATKTVFVSDIATPASATAITGLENVQVIDLIIDVTKVYVITYDSTNTSIKIFTIDVNVDDDSAILAETFTSSGTFTSSESVKVAPTAVHFVSTGATADDKHFIFVFPDETQSYINNFRTLSDLSTATDFDETVFDVSDDTTKNSPIIGAYAYGTTIYLVTNEGILITSDNNLATFTAVNAADSSEFMSIVLNPSGSTASIFSIPMTVITKQTPTTELLIIGGLSDIYYYDIATPTTTEIPIEFDTTTDLFYSNISSTQILDFYNVPGDGDFSLFTATSNKWIWETEDKNTASTQLL
jgi:hypothetical protein